MFDGKQVLTITNKIKSADMGGLSKELTERIGTGNYDNNRTKYNVEYISLCSTNLASSTYKTLTKNNVEYNKSNKKINLLNGCVITSGQEFFKSLGMKFEDTERLHLTGEHKNEPIQKAIINSKEDIPERVLEYFKSSHEFLSNLVGEENIVYSAIHFDEDTPHMHFYFTPVVYEVHRKVFETDNEGHQILKPYIGKDGIEKMIPIQKKDDSGKNMYIVEKGKFLNSDQFWKDKGFKTSFAKIQDDYNKYINDLGFNLDRGEIGANKHHTTKAEKHLEELQEKVKIVEQEYTKNKALNSEELIYKDKISDIDTNHLLNPEKGKIMGYKEKDIISLSNYSKEITKSNLQKDKELNQKNIEINHNKKNIELLNSEIKNLKSGKTLKEKDEIIKKQETIIEHKENEIDYQNSLINKLYEKIDELTEVIDKIKSVAINLYKALMKSLGKSVNKYQEYDEHEFKYESRRINKDIDKDNFEL